MTLPPDPTLFLAHCKAHKTPTHSQPCKEQNMPTHNLHTPADEYLSTLEQHINNNPLFSDHAHPPPYKTTFRKTKKPKFTFALLTIWN